MRNIEFNELKLKNIKDEESFYQFYLKNLQTNVDNNTTFNSPEKQYEIFYLNILGGKIILLNKNYINSKKCENQELFFDYSIALKVYNLMLDILDGIEAEKNEPNELYKSERLKKDKEITQLKQKDENIFKSKQQEYDIIINSDIYVNYLKLKEENTKLKSENQILIEKINNTLIHPNNISFFKKLINKFKNKRLPMN